MRIAENTSLPGGYGKENGLATHRDSLKNCVRRVENMQKKDQDAGWMCDRDAWICVDVAVWWVVVGGGGVQNHFLPT